MMPRLPLWLYSALGVLAVMGVVTGSGETPPSPAPGPSPSPSPTSVRAVTVLPEGPIRIDRRQDARSYTATIFLRNESASAYEVTLRIALVDRKGSSAGLATHPSSIPVPAHSVVPVAVRVGPAPGSTAGDVHPPLRGYLTVQTSPAGSSGTASASTVREVKVLSPLPSTLQGWVVLGALAVALLCVVAGADAGKIDEVTDQPMAAPSWSESWGSNITLGAALVTALLGPMVFPGETRFLPKTSYTVLSVLFATIVGLAPGVFGALRTSEIKTDGAVKTLVHRGYPRAFLLAAGFTLWGAVGQLVLVQFAILELRATGDLGAPLGAALHVLAGALTGMVVVYGVRSIIRVLDGLHAAKATAEAAPLPEAVRAAGGVPPPEPFEWNLL
jgi:hypothetical protein